MAQKRMFTKTITNSDKFLDLSLSAQALYFHLNMNADDDGFIDNAKTIKRMIGASDEDLRILVEQNFLILFNDGLVVVKDWRLHNTIRQDRYKPTIYRNQFKMLEFAENKEYQELKNEGNLVATNGGTTGNQVATDNKKYMENEFPFEIPETLESQEYQGVMPVDNFMATNGEPNDDQLATQYRLDKDRLDKNRLDDDIYIDKGREKNPLLVIETVYESKIGVIDGDQFNQLTEYVTIDKMEIEVVLRAISEAADNGKRYFKYILGILRNWKQNGITKLVQVEERERQRLEQKARFTPHHQPPQRQSNVPDWTTEPINTEKTEQGQKALQDLQKELSELEGGIE